MRGEDTLVIVNPSAGNGRGGREWERFANRRQVPKYVFTTPVEGTALLIRRACERGCRAILVCGGDGTVNEAVNALMEVERALRPALGVLPAGTANDFARAVGHTRWDRVLDAAAGAARAVDVGVATGSFGRRHFVVAAFIGAPALMAQRANEGGKPARGLLGYLPYLREAVQYSAPVLAEFGTESWSGRAATLVVSNTPNGGGGIAICPKARVDDGMLDLLIVEQCRHRVLTAWLVGTTVLMACLKMPILSIRSPGANVRRATAKRVNLKAMREGVCLALDGEITGELPATIEVVPAALDVLVP